MDAGGRVVAALTMHGPLPRMNPERCETFVPRLRQTAEQVQLQAALESARTDPGFEDHHGQPNRHR